MSTTAPPVRRPPVPDVVLPPVVGPVHGDGHGRPATLPTVGGPGADRARLDPGRAAGRSAAEDHPRCSPSAHGAAKRGLDVVVAVVLLALAAPVLVAVSLLVALTSDGPVLFRQDRVGTGGHPFRLYKFRTMYVAGVPTLDELTADRDDVGPLFKMVRDPRVTPVGRVLRRHSLDELPQLWNVLRGDMSLVGPRPALPSEVARYDERARRRLAVKPGLTGPWQVGGRSDLSWDDGLRLDLDYVDRSCVAYDVRVLVATVRVVLRPVGAY